MDNYTIEQIKQIIRDCEDYCQSGVSTYSQEREMITAYRQIVREIRMDKYNTEDDGK